MKRNPRKLGWTKASRARAGKEMTVDSTLQFAQRRNVPTRYNRDLWLKTVKAMERIQEIRTKRERVFYKKRMQGKRARELAAARNLVDSHSHLLPKMRGSEKRRLALEQGLAQEDIDRLEETNAVPVEKSRLFGKEKLRQKVRTDGAVEVMGDGDIDGGMDVDSE
ncbi:Uu.00g059030.m01.CDS01 [Anthostomella pinea]|uniref:Uu.00g059030.m01.CDS01 n=1 Tax=Anthostomella pinea TaxID=933095 RepID=A0AAI8VSU1_9PEZI|nr:Uu.00g059030.m01.CDS01 [Anthostomella pinea]